MRRIAHLKGSLRLRMPNLMVPNMIAAKQPAISGAMAHDAAIWDTLPFFHPHCTLAPAAIPAPTRAPTTVWVVETGKPDLVAKMSQVALPNSVQAMVRIRVAGLALKCLISMTLLLIVPVTRDPRATAPTNSVIMAKTPTCGIVRVRAATEVA